MARLSDLVPFPGGWWHANDDVGCADVIRSSLQSLGLDPSVISEPVVQELAALADGVLTDADEDRVRRHQIGRAARHMNLALAAAGSDQRLYAFADDPADDEPLWLLLTTADRALLLASGSVLPASGIERGYDPADGSV